MTTMAGETPYGTTVSAFMSLSMDPPMMLVSLRHGSTLLSTLGIGSTVGINVLSVTQSELASHFAEKCEDKFAGVLWSLRDGAPSLVGRHAWICLSVTEMVQAHDHMLVIGSVKTAEFAAGNPLIYWRHTFGTHTAA